MKSLLINVTLACCLIAVANPVFGQFGGSPGGGGGGHGGDDGGQHEYPDIYAGDFYSQLNPNASGHAFIDRSDQEDYPTIVFSEYADYLESISHEEANWSTFFPLGVNLVFLDFDDANDEILYEKFVYEPASGQYLFADAPRQALHSLMNPSSVLYFGLFQEAEKPVKTTIGHIYVIWIDTNSNGVRDPGEDTYVGSSTRVENRFLVHDQNGMLNDPKGTIKVYPVQIEGEITPNDDGEIDNDGNPNTGGGNDGTDTGGGDFLPGGNGGGVGPGGKTTREILEYYEQLVLEDVIDDNQDQGDDRDPGDVPVGDIPEVKNKKHVVSPTRMTDTFGDAPPTGTTQGGEVPFTYKKVLSFQGSLGQ